MQYWQLTDEDLDAAAAIMESIKRHWAVADQQIFIAAVIVNPFYQGQPFAQLYFLNNAGNDCCRASILIHYPYLLISHSQGRCQPHSSALHVKFSIYSGPINCPDVYAFLIDCGFVGRWLPSAQNHQCISWRIASQLQNAPLIISMDGAPVEIWTIQLYDSFRQFLGLTIKL